MPYTLAEIENIQRLAKDADLKNVLLAFELIRGRGLVPQLVTDIYWIYNRLIWAQEEALEQEVYLFFQQYWTQKTDLTHLSPLLVTPSKLQQSLHPDFEAQAEVLGLNLPQLAKQIHAHFGLNYNPINSFLFKYGTAAIQEQVLPFLKVRAHNGRFLLDLGGFKLKTLPAVLLLEKQIQTLKIWGNDLDKLPDFWEQFDGLEVLNIAENQLTELPPSFSSLSNLQKLYAQNNRFEVPSTIDRIKQLPNIKHLTISNPNEQTATYSPADYTALRQLEALINHGKVHTSEKEQLRFLGLYMNNPEALQKLPLIDLFDALSDSNEETRKRAKAKILNWEGATFNGKLPPEASVAILGIVSFATRSKLNQNKEKGIRFTTEINKDTTHIVIGDYPENYAPVQDRPFIFMVEEDL